MRPWARLDQLREHPQAEAEEVRSLLERLAEAPDPRDPRPVRHALAAVLALTACAVLAVVGQGLRGVVRATGRRMHLPAAVEHTTRVVLAPS
ncbi:hypothetical protein OG206_00670 [Streptomyces sp. NBC_01341]|uniref:hypothetical protein n=1 Tax=Streptomyces sp. NBC_01341 TaxID=2903831 RepID=UPI002E104D80|nr:hypothetical protein OG206_00670 [Streptomyces sp. NBC_01341]